MKKITLLIAIVFSGIAVTAQTNLEEVLGSSSPSIINQSVRLLDPCSINVDSNDLENGGFLGGETNQLLAIDVDVEANSTLSIEQFIPTLIGPGTTFSLNIYNTIDDAPGDLITNIADLTAAEGVVTGNNFGFDFIQYELTLDTPYLLEGGDEGAKFWIEMLADSDGWESTTATVEGNFGAFNNDNGENVWTVGNSEYVYIINGDCDTALSVDTDVLSEVSLFPNPTSDVINIKVPAGVELVNATLYDVLGKAVNATLSNGQINVASLTRGMYLLNVVTDAGILTEKILVK